MSPTRIDPKLHWHLLRAERDTDSSHPQAQSDALGADGRARRYSPNVDCCVCVCGSIDYAPRIYARERGMVKGEG